MAQLDSQTTAVIQQLITALGPVARQLSDGGFRRASDAATFPMVLTKAQISAANTAIAAGSQALATSAASPPSS